MPIAAGMVEKQWNVLGGNSEVSAFAEQTGISEILAQILLNRGISDPKTAKSFIRPSLSELIEPHLMPGAADAAEKIKKAISDRQKIAVYGDYDVDGITAVSILLLLLKMLGADATFYIPHRVDEGYGLNTEAVKGLIEQGVKLIITVDCGICAAEAVSLARSKNVDIIVTDHHQLPPVLPEASVIVHPHLDEQYRNPHSAGAVVAFKLAWALAEQYKKGAKLDERMRNYLLYSATLASMGTIADVVDIRGENRIIAGYGLKALAQTKVAGLNALIETAGLTGKDIDSTHIGFRLAPMLNAAGRMGHSRLAVELLTSQNQLRCFKIAQYLKQQNEQRRQVERKIFKQADEMIKAACLDHPDRRTIVLSDEQWHTGVIGIVASRIIDKYYKPTILINTSEGIGQGSARSVPGFNIHRAISACGQSLISFGGHEMAAGLKIDTDRIHEFTAAFEEYAKDCLAEEKLSASLDIDGVFKIGEFKPAVMQELARLEPYGPGNEKPLFASLGVELIAPPRRCGNKSEHIQLSIRDETAAVRCIGFRMGRLEKKLLEADYFKIAYSPQINHFNGKSSLQFVIEDIRFE